jgi:hypothetical protein
MVILARPSMRSHLTRAARKAQLGDVPLGQFARLRQVLAWQRRTKGAGMTDVTNPLAEAVLTAEVVQVPAVTLAPVPVRPLPLCRMTAKSS